MLSNIRAATTSIDVCMHVLTLPQFIRILHRKHTDGVRVRVIVDGTMSEGRASGSATIAEHGIPMRKSPVDSLGLMHHKFIVVDVQLAMSGSLNWTNAGIRNHESICSSSDSSCVSLFSAEFERLWHLFDERTLSGSQQFPFRQRSRHEQLNADMELVLQ